MYDKFVSLDEQMKSCKTLEDLVGKNGLIQKLTKDMLENMLQAELDAHLGYQKYENKGKNSGDSRNGFSHKKVRSANGVIDIAIPRDRNGLFEPKIIPKHSKDLNSFDKKIISLYSKGASTRDIQEHVKEIYGADISHDMVSMITDKVIPVAQQWQNRPLESMYVLVYFDALFYFVHDKNKVVKKAAYSCVGIDKNGKKDILGIWVGNSESATFWKGILNDLKARGVKKILIACMDGLKGLPKVIKKAFPGVKIQLCVVHMIRYSLSQIAHKDKKAFMASLKTIYQASNESEGLKALQTMNEQWTEKYPSAVKTWTNNWENIAGFLNYPDELRKIAYTNNPLESVNRSFRKVTKAKSIFPNNTALHKMLFLAARDMTKKWKPQIKNWDKIHEQVKQVFGEECMAC